MLNYSLWTYCFNNPLSNVDPTGNSVYRQNIITSLFFKRKGATYGDGGGGAGGSTGGYTGHISILDPWGEMYALLNSSSGGYWQSGFGGFFYTSQLEAYSFNGGTLKDKGNNLLKDFVQRVAQLKTIFESIGCFFNDTYGGEVLSYPAKLVAFGYLQITGAKIELMNPKAFSYSPFYNGGYINDKYYSSDDFGNYFYGVAAKAMGITLFDAIQGAGIYAIFSGSVTNWTNILGFFDEIKDTQTIIRGYYGKY